MSLTLTACSKVLGAAYWASSVKKADRLVTFPECCVCACLRVAHEFWMGSFFSRVQRFWVHWLRAKQWWGLLIGNCDSSEKWHFHVHVHEFVCRLEGLEVVAYLVVLDLKWKYMALEKSSALKLLYSIYLAIGFVPGKCFLCLCLSHPSSCGQAGIKLDPAADQEYFALLVTWFCLCWSNAIPPSNMT